jgi:asparagine synthase (glutamine-hydrolysing)
MVYYFLSFDLVENPENKAETFFNNVHKLEAAHYIRYDLKSGKREKQPYWNIEDVKVNPNIRFDEACDKFRELFFESIEKRLRSDVPIGSSLSGGLDSSSVVSSIQEVLKRKNMKNTQFTFSARFDNKAFDEGEYIDTIVNRTQSKHYNCYPQLINFISNAKNIAYHQDEPFGSASIFAQWEVFKTVHQTPVKVILDGQGADEYLAGYPPFFRMLLVEQIRRNPFKNYKKIILDYQEKNTTHNKHIDLKKLFAQAYLADFYNLFSKAKFLSLGHRCPDTIPTTFYKRYKHSTPPFHQFNTMRDGLKFWTFKYGLEKLLRFADRSSMAFSLEVRLPFLSHELVEFVFSLPSEYKLKGNWTKSLIRNSMNDILPSEIAWRKNKLGFQVPENDWQTHPEWQRFIKPYFDLCLDYKFYNGKRYDWSFVSLGLWLDAIN